MKIASSDAADNGTTPGLGVQSVEIHGLSATGADQDEVLLTNGTTLDKLSAIEEDVKQSSRLAMRLQRLGQRLAPEKKEANLNEIVRSTLELVQSVLKKKNLKLEEKLDPTLDDGPPVYVDAGQIGQVIINLVLNAVDASHARSTITVATKREAERAIVRVTDYGAGIESAIMPELFRPFFTTKERGVGLGLYISKIIVDNHQGTIYVESRPRKGASFWVSLPLAD